MNPKTLRILNEITAAQDKAMAGLKLKVQDVEALDDGLFKVILEPKEGAATKIRKKAKENR